MAIVRTQHFSKALTFALKGAVCTGLIHVQKAGDEVRFTGRIDVPRLRYHLFLSTEETVRMCVCNTAGLYIVEKAETSCYAGNPAVYLSDPVRSSSELSDVCLTL